MKNNLFKISCITLLFGILLSLLAGCDVEGIGDESTRNAEGTASSEQILKAWTGDFSEEKLKSVIEDYRSNYQPAGDKNADMLTYVSFETDFDISSYTVARVSRVDDSDIEVELNGYIDLIIDSDRDGRQITIYTDWWYYDGEWVQKYPVWSYLVLVRDAEGGKHYYYFRTDYSSDTVNE